MTNYKVIVAYITKHSTENAEKVHTQITQGLGPKPYIICDPDYTCKTQRNSEIAHHTRQEDTTSLTPRNQVSYLKAA